MRRFATLAALTVAAAVMVSAQTADKKPAAPQAQGQDTEAALIKMERQATAAEDCGGRLDADLARYHRYQT